MRSSIFMGWTYRLSCVWESISTEGFYVGRCDSGAEAGG